MNGPHIAALFLLATGSKGDESGAVLGDVLAAADFINRTVLDHDEIETAVRFLLGRRLLTADGDRFAPTPTGRELLERSHAHTYDAARERLEAILRELPEPHPSSDWTISPADVDAAADAYTRMAQGEGEGKG